MANISFSVVEFDDYRIQSKFRELQDAVNGIANGDIPVPSSTPTFEDMEVHGELALVDEDGLLNLSAIDQDRPIIKVALTSDSVTADPATDPVAGFIKIQQGGVAVYLPVYLIDGS